MKKGKGTRKGASNWAADSPDVRCDTCGRWVFLDETPFETQEGAASGGPFVCSICCRLSPMEMRMQQQDCLIEALHSKLTTLETLVLELTARLGEVEQRSADVAGNAKSTPVVEAIPETPSQNHPPPTSPLQQGERDDGIDLTGMANVQATLADTIEGQRDVHADDNDEAKPGEGQPEGKSQTCEKEAQGGSLVPLPVHHSQQQQPTFERPPEQDSAAPVPSDSGSSSPRTPRVHKTGKRDKRSQRKGPNWERNTDERPPLGIPREVVVVGDENVGLVAATVVAGVGTMGAVELIHGERTTMEEAIGYAAEYEQGARDVPRRYILHAGTHDVLAGRPQDVMEVLEARWKGRPGSLVVCSVPEIVNRGGEVRAAAILVNAKLKKWCKKTGSRFLDLNNTGSSQRFRKDGFTYTAKNTEEVGKTISELAARFLGVTPPPREEQMWPQKRRYLDMYPPQQTRSPRSHYRGKVEQPPNYNARQERWKTRTPRAHHRWGVKQPPSGDTRQGRWELTEQLDEQGSHWRRNDLANLIEISVQRALAKARPEY